jgi:hypothetical protein
MPLDTRCPDFGNVFVEVVVRSKWGAGATHNILMVM